MENILFINACVRPESRTYVLAQEILSKLDGSITEVVLENEEIKPLNLERLGERDSLAGKEDFSSPLTKYAKQFAEADAVVIAAPYWDLSFPAMMKNYIEAITVSGITFKYTEEGFPSGLCKAKKLYYAMTAGGPVFCDFGFEYVKAMATNFFGIQEVACFKAEFLDVIGNNVDEIMSGAKQKIAEYFEK